MSPRTLRVGDVCERCGELPASYVVCEEPDARPRKVCAIDCSALRRRGWLLIPAVST